MPGQEQIKGKWMEACLPDMKLTDYVLVYKCAPATEKRKSNVQEAKEIKAETLRTLFEKQLEKEGFEITKETTTDQVFIRLHCPFWRLTREAERVHLEMPLKDKKLAADKGNCFTNAVNKCVKSYSEDDFICMTFEISKGHLFENFDSPDTFFRPAQRSLLVHLILNETDVSGCYNDQRSEIDEDDCLTSRCALPQLLLMGVYSDSFILHEECSSEGDEQTSTAGDILPLNESSAVLQSVEAADKRALTRKATSSASPVLQRINARGQLNKVWPNMFAFQPMCLIREYFGEEIALYFAWSGLLALSIVIPALFGLSIFLWGLYVSFPGDGHTVQVATNATQKAALDSIKDLANDALRTIKAALDNDITPWYSVIVCLWGTLFLEMWKRRNAVLAYEWDVEQFEANEPDRPQFVGSKKIDPVTHETIHHYPAFKRIMKYLLTFSVFLLMVCVVLIVSISIIVYRVVLRTEHCNGNGTSTDDKQWNNVQCTLVTSLCATVMNAIVIMILGKLYEMLAYKLTDWENHKTATEYRDALIIKLFAFAFANSYATLYYIAFFKSASQFWENGMFGVSKYQNYRDGYEQGGSMSVLSLQVLVLIVLKPLPKLLKDVVIPAVMKLVRRCKCCRSKGAAYVASTDKGTKQEFLNNEWKKPQLGDFTLSEYTEKVIQYGYLMLFAVSLPLAPMIVLLTNVADRYVDSKRMLWWYRRPVAAIAQDIGVWYYILEFLNICGVITNAFLIAFTSQWGLTYLGSNQDSFYKLVFVLIFEHGVFAIKFLMAMIIPDVPSSVKEAMRRKHFIIGNLVKAEQEKADPGKEIARGDPQEEVHSDSDGVRRRPDKYEKSNGEKKSTTMV